MIRPVKIYSVETNVANMSGLGIEDTGPQLGRNLTYGMLDAIGRAIVVGDYDGSTFPTEDQLAKQHGVSRSVTSEAVKTLQAKGLLIARHAQGTRGQPPTSERRRAGEKGAG